MAIFDCLDRLDPRELSLRYFPNERRRLIVASTNDLSSRIDLLSRLEPRRKALSNSEPQALVESSRNFKSCVWMTNLSSSNLMETLYTMTTQMTMPMLASLLYIKVAIIA